MTSVRAAFGTSDLVADLSADSASDCDTDAVADFPTDPVAHPGALTHAVRGHLSGVLHFRED